MYEPYQNILILQNHSGKRHTLQKGSFVWILHHCGRKLANESGWLAITAAVVTCQSPPSKAMREADYCGCSGRAFPESSAVAAIDSIRNSFSVKTSISPSVFSNQDPSLQINWKCNQYNLVVILSGLRLWIKCVFLWICARYSIHHRCPVDLWIAIPLSWKKEIILKSEYIL